MVPLRTGNCQRLAVKGRPNGAFMSRRTLDYPPNTWVVALVVLRTAAALSAAATSHGYEEDDSHGNPRYAFYNGLQRANPEIDLQGQNEERYQADENENAGGTAGTI